METKEFTYEGRGYKIISHPTILEDKYAIVMVWMMETDKRAGHYRILKAKTPRREMLRKFIVSKIKLERGGIGNDQEEK